MEKVVIAASARTPIGAFDGKLKDYREQKLAVIALNEAIKRAGIAKDAISELIFGIAKQTSGPSNAARYIGLDADLPEAVPAYTVQRQSASGIQAVLNGYYKIKVGSAQVIAAGGAESMTSIPYEIQDARYAFDPNTRIIFDPIPAQVAGSQPVSQYGVVTMDGINEKIAEKYGFSAEQQAEYAAASGEKAAAHAREGNLIPLQRKVKKAVEEINADELCTVPDILARPADAAACCILVGGDRIDMCSGAAAEIVSVGLSAGDPAGEGLVGMRAVQTALGKAGKTIRDMDLVEFAELTAAQSLAVLQELAGQGMSASRVSELFNVFGGALASGSPWGAAGNVSLDRLLYALRTSGRKYGLLLCGAEGGQAAAIVVKSM